MHVSNELTACCYRSVIMDIGMGKGGGLKSLRFGLSPPPKLWTLWPMHEDISLRRAQSFTLLQNWYEGVVRSQGACPQIISCTTMWFKKRCSIALSSHAREGVAP